MRFFWKRLDADSTDRGGRDAVACKVLKAVNIPLVFDALPFTTGTLHKVLAERRAASQKAADAAFKAAAAGGAGAGAAMQEEAPAAGGGGGAGAGAGSAADEQACFGPGVPAGFQGYFDLHALVAHKGRSSSSGHYISFAKNDAPGASKDSWLVFDDDTVEETTAEVVTSRLKGGGDDL